MAQISAKIPPEIPPNVRFGRTELKICRFWFLAVPSFTPPSVFRRFRKKRDFEKIRLLTFYEKTEIPAADGVGLSIRERR